MFPSTGVDKTIDRRLSFALDCRPQRIHIHAHMKAQPECIVCLFKQALNTALVVTGNQSAHREILLRLAGEIPRMKKDISPAALSQPVYRITTEVTGIPDPFERQKRETNRIALEMLPGLRRLLARETDPLDAAIHAAAAGNIIDLGIGHAFDIRRDVLKIMRQPFAISAVRQFKRDLGPGRAMLYLGDNAGEIVFDTLLVEEIMKTGTSVVYAVKSAPIINDATMEDAEVSGMTKLTMVIETGSDDIGVNLANSSREFRKVFRAADIVLAKGHGNFETCDDLPGNIYSLLKAKCDVVARELGVKLGDIVFKKKRTTAIQSRSGRRQHG